MDKFIKLYDRATPVKDNSKVYCEPLLNKDGKPTGCMKSVTENNLFDNIKALLEVKSIDNRTDVMKLGDIYRLYDAFVYQTVLEPKNNVKNYIQALSWFKGNIDKSIKYLLDFSHEKEWVEALSYLKGSLQKSGVSMDVDCPQQQIDRANAVKVLKKEFKIEYKFDEHYRLILSDEEKVAKAVADLMCDFGGAHFLNAFLGNFEYIPSIDRLFIPRQGSTGLPQNHQPEAPLNYLLNLAIGNLSKNSIQKRAVEEITTAFNRIYCLASVYCLAYYEAQSYLIWDLIMHRDCDIIENWTRLAYKDGLNYFRQSSQDFIIDYCEFLSKAAEKEGFLKAMPFSLSELCQVFTILAKLTDPYGVQYFVKSQLNAVPHIEAILKAISQPIEDVNKGFEIASDYDKVTCWTTPVVKVDEDNYILLPRTIGASGWYDKLTAILRDNCKKNFDFQHWLGTLQESYVISKFKSKNIDVKSGKYKVQWNPTEKAEEGEADFIIEGKDFKLLIESKTKSITRKSLSGYDIKILIDLFQGLFNSQTQAFRTAAALHSKNEVVLCDAQWNPISTVNYNGQTMEKITLTYGDYGFFQDRILVDRILEELYQNDFNLNINAVPDYIIPSKNKKSVDKSFAKIAEEQSKMRRYIREMEKVNKDLIQNVFFDSWHLSLEQLMYLISISHDAESFYKELKKCKSMNTTTLDFWNERYYAQVCQKGVGY